MGCEKTSRFEIGNTIGNEARDPGAPDGRSLHPNTLLVYWELYSRTHQWTSARIIAEALVTVMPDQPIGWIYRSFALQRLGRVDSALAGSLEAANRFPDDWRIAYNTASYSCLLGNVGEAWSWLDRAITLGNADVVKSAALEDTNFKPLWVRVGQI